MSRILIFIACALICACHKPDKEPAPQVTRTSTSAKTDKADPSPIDEARFHVHASRIQAIPVEPLPRHVDIRGVALPLYNEFPSMSYEDMIEGISRSGASHVSLIVSWNQRTISSNHIASRSGESPDRKRVIEVARAAREQGLKVIVFPILHIQLRNEGEWRGKMAPDAPALWWESYRKFILHWAEVARLSNADVFSIGSELSSMEVYENEWRDLIQRVRESYEGKLIYSANWDHYRTPQFWDALDYVGVSSYFEVARRRGEPIHRVSARWKEHRDDLIEFASDWKKPVVLTEVGYPSVPDAALEPWNYAAKPNPDVLAQAAAYRSLVDGWHEPPTEFGGLVVWHGWGPGGRNDTGYSIFEKPSQRLLQSWFQRR